MWVCVQVCVLSLVRAVVMSVGAVGVACGGLRGSRLMEWLAWLSVPPWLLDV